VARELVDNRWERKWGGKQMKLCLDDEGIRAAHMGRWSGGNGVERHGGRDGAGRCPKAPGAHGRLAHAR
jgi:hypothetical protein